MWEHKVVSTYDGHDRDLQSYLDEASADGWQLVSVCINNNDYFYLFFKRKVVNW